MQKIKKKFKNLNFCQKPKVSKNLTGTFNNDEMKDVASLTLLPLQLCTFTMVEKIFRFSNKLSGQS